MKKILQILDQTTMYRVVLYVMVFLVIVAFGLSVTGLLYAGPVTLLISLAVLLVSSSTVHYICAYLWKAPANIESSLVTALILFFIFSPETNIHGLTTLVVVSIVAVASKYIIARHHLHIFNPVAFSAVVVGLVGFDYPIWWIGSSLFLLPVALGGFIITYKIKRFPLVISTIGAALITSLVLAYFRGSLSWSIVESFFIAWPIVFFATVMVTEPLATPAGRRNHILYGSLVGSLTSIPFSLWVFVSSPELALVIANLLFYPLSLRGRLILTMESIKTIARDTYEFSFVPSFPIKFKAGQYLEWTLPHGRPDVRGIRRYFTIASSPTSNNVSVAMRITDKHSSFKDVLHSMKPGGIVYATALGGDFVLPKNCNKKKIVMIAGGIGVTPFRSMVSYLVDTNTHCDITLLYANNTVDDIAYRDLWDHATQQIGLKTIYVLTKPPEDWTGEVGFVTDEMIRKHVDDMDNTLFYVSGPPGMVKSCKSTLQKCNVSSTQIISDFFPGLG